MCNQYVPEGWVVVLLLVSPHETEEIYLQESSLLLLTEEIYLQESSLLLLMVATRLLLKYNIRPVGPYVQLGTIFRVSMKW